MNLSKYGSGGEVPKPVTQLVNIAINCGRWDPQILLARLRNGGCTHRHAAWAYSDIDHTIRATLEMTEIGYKAMQAWLREPYVIPSELHIEFS